MKRKILVGSILILVFGVTSMLWLQQSSLKDQLEYSTSIISPQMNDKSFMAFGKIYFEQETQLSPTMEGLVTQVNVQPGDSVKQGQILATLDVDLVEVKKIEFLFALRAQAVNANKIEPYLKKINDLESQDHLSFIESSRLKAELLQMVGQQLNYQKSIEDRLLKFQGKVVTAPFDGIIRDVRLKIGQKVSLRDEPGTNSIFMTPPDSNYKVDLEIADDLMSYMTIGQEINISVPLANLKHIQGKITSIPQISFEDKKQRYFKVTASLNQTPMGYYSGMRVNALIESTPIKGAIWIPKAAFDIHLDESKVIKMISFLDEGQHHLSSRTIANNRSEELKDENKAQGVSSLGKKTSNEVFPIESKQSEIYLLTEDHKVIKVNVLRGIESKNFVAVYAPSLVGSRVITHYKPKPQFD